jgi:hypothetical protein
VVVPTREGTEGADREGRGWNTSAKVAPTVKAAVEPGTASISHSLSDHET